MPPSATHFVLHPQLILPCIPTANPTRASPSSPSPHFTGHLIPASISLHPSTLSSEHPIQTKHTFSHWPPHPTERISSRSMPSHRPHLILPCMSFQQAHLIPPGISFQWACLPPPTKGVRVSQQSA